MSSMPNRFAVFAFAMAAGLLPAIPAPAQEGMVGRIAPDNPLIHFYGRWHRTADRAVTVNTGSEVIVHFQGSGLVFEFDTTHLEPPMPELWVRVDDKDWRVEALAPELAIVTGEQADGAHVVRFVVKGTREKVNRWIPPLQSAIVLNAIALNEGARLAVPPPSPQYRVEFLGDSITEGILAIKKGERSQWPSLCDGRRAYAYQTAALLGFEPRVVGFGRQGITVAGNGGVPRAVLSFPYVYDKIEKDRWRPDAVVVNMGTNDRNVKANIFTDEYFIYVRKIRESYPRAHIFCMRPFNGAHEKEIKTAIQRHNAAGDKRVHFVDTTGWIDPKTDTTDGLHPNLEGHKKVAGHLATILRLTMRVIPGS